MAPHKRMPEEAGPALWTLQMLRKRDEELSERQRNLERMKATAIGNAIEAGASWSVVASALGQNRGQLHKWFTKRSNGSV